jgi:hypothetical protein
MTGREMVEHLRVSGQFEPDDLQIIAVLDGERPDDVMEILTLPTGEQVRTGRLQPRPGGVRRAPLSNSSASRGRIRPAALSNGAAAPQWLTRSLLPSSARKAGDPFGDSAIAGGVATTRGVRPESDFKKMSVSGLAKRLSLFHQGSVRPRSWSARFGDRFGGRQSGRLQQLREPPDLACSWPSGQLREELCPDSGQRKEPDRAAGEVCGDPRIRSPR